jgi:MFS family permease
MSRQDVNRQLVYLFISNFAILFIGMGLFPLLPVYASQFGATSTVVGVYLAIVYLSITAGTMMTGWLADRFTRKRTFVAAGVLGAPALALLGQATALWQVVILTATVWFAGGVGLALVSVFTGLYADKSSRGKSFSLLALSSPLGAVIGGTVVGRLVEWQGYPLMFAALALVWSAWPLVALWKVQDKPPVLSARAPTDPAPGTARQGKWASTGRERRVGTRASGSKNAARLGSTFQLLLVATLLSAVTVRVGRMGLSLSMQAEQFSPGAIANATVIGGLVTIPVTLWFGTLSDRLGRKRLLMAGFLVAAGGALTLSMAHQLWQFWLASALLLVAVSANGSVAAAFATDLLAPEALSRGMPRLHAMNWIAGIVGFAGGGYLMDTLEGTSLFVAIAALSLVAAALSGLLPGGREEPAPVLPSVQAAAASGCV